MHSLIQGQIHERLDLFPTLHSHSKTSLPQPQLTQYAMSSSPVILIFGAGANTGISTAKKFAKEGYKVAAVSRNPAVELKAAADLIVPADLTDPKTVEAAFEQVIKELGVPHVVVYSGESLQKSTAQELKGSRS